MDDRDERIRRLEEKIARLEKIGNARGYFGYEYKSKTSVFGMPLVHIAQGIDAQTGKPRIARGFIAIGNIAVGVFALGGLSCGVFSFGGVGVGLFTFGGLALGLLIAAGGLAVGFAAMGGLAVGWLAIGGGALGFHTVSGMGADPETAHYLRRLLKFLNLHTGNVVD